MLGLFLYSKKSVILCFKAAKRYVNDEQKGEVSFSPRGRRLRGVKPYKNNVLALERAVF